MLSEDQVSTHVLDHLGLVAAVMDKVGLIKIIDERLPIPPKSGFKVTMGQRVAAMVLNGLGFMDDRLYMFPEFLDNKPISRFFGPDVKAEYFNDDALGRCLDAIYEYGVTKLFSQLAFEIGVRFDLLGKTARLDTTSLVVYGDYNDQDGSEGPENTPEKTPKNSKEEEADGFKVTYGYSKDGRGDLKQVVLNLATTGIANLPVWMSPHSGNASDKVILQQAAERMKMFAEGLKEAPSFIFVGDSAIYEKCVEKSSDLRWLSRVPHSNKKAKTAIALKDEDLAWTELDKGYKVVPIKDCHYKGVKQRWAMVFSEQMHKRELATLNKRIAAEYTETTKTLKQFGQQTFKCTKDAEKALNPLVKKLKYHVITYHFETVVQHKIKGRPKADAIPDQVGHKVLCNLTQDTIRIEESEREKGRFILATNEMDEKALSNAEMLHEYKEQTHTEAGFRFIKGDAFEVSGVFLKKPSRIQALMMVMTLCLMMYNLAQHFLRTALKEQNDSIPDQLQKPTQKPTMQRVAKMFHGVQVVYIRFEEGVQEIVSNLKDVLKKIIAYFGPVAMRIYGLG